MASLCLCLSIGVSVCFSSRALAASAAANSQAPIMDEDDEDFGGAVEPPPRELSEAEKTELNSFIEKRSTRGWPWGNWRDNYNHIDRNKVVPPTLLEKALSHFHFNRHLFANKNYISIIDYSRHSKWRRFFIIDMRSGSVTPVHVAHGSGSDQSKSGFAKLFSDNEGSKMSSLGFARTAETYYGKHGLSLRLDGMSLTNRNLRNRAVVVHGASYVHDYDERQGNSWGCPAVSQANYQALINRIKGGSLIFSGLSGKNN